MINDHKRSLFSYAIISQVQEAVELIYDLVAGVEETEEVTRRDGTVDRRRIRRAGIFGTDHTEVRGKAAMRSTQTCCCYYWHLCTSGI